MGRDRDFVVGELDCTTLKVGGTAGPSGVAGVLVNPGQFLLNVTMADVSTAASVWVVSPYAATIEKMYSVINGTIATAPAVITAEIAGTAVTGASISITHTGSAAGDVDSCTPTALNTVTAGQAIEILTSGASTNTVIGTFTLVMQRT